MPRFLDALGAERAGGPNATCVITNPGGGSYGTQNPVTGAFKITLPVSFSDTEVRLHVGVAVQATSQGFDLVCGGFNSGSSATWTNPYAYTMGDDSGNCDWTVRFGHDGISNCYIAFGELGTVWNYPQVQVLRAELGFTTVTYAQWSSGWSVTPITSFPGAVSQTITKTQVGRWLDGVAVVKTNDSRLSASGTQRTMAFFLS